MKDSRFLGIPWPVMAVLGLFMALIFAVLWPQEFATGALLHDLVLRWFHPLAWLLLSLSFFLRARRLATPADYVTYLALAVFGLFFYLVVRG